MDIFGNNLTTAQLYNPLTQSFPTTGTMTTVRIGHNAVLLLNGKVLLVGGEDQNSATLDSTELYDPEAGKFTAAADMHVRRRGLLLGG